MDSGIWASWFGISIWAVISIWAGFQFKLEIEFDRGNCIWAGIWISAAISIWAVISICAEIGI
jgi:hypothetical protein